MAAGSDPRLREQTVLRNLSGMNAAASAIGAEWPDRDTQERVRQHQFLPR